MNRREYKFKMGLIKSLTDLISNERGLLIGITNNTIDSLERKELMTHYEKQSESILKCISDLNKP